MESTEVDIKPIVPTDDFPDTSLLSTVRGDTPTCKFKQSRYEDVWPEDVHAAFMEAVSLYPPMGKRRLKYYRVSTHENEHISDANRARSFGRCQLIQSYILEKTGKNRSRKQVSSHLQRLKKIYKDNPAMRPLFSERLQPSSEHRSLSATSQDILANISSSTRHLKSDFDLTINLHNTDAGTVDSPTFPHNPEASFISGSSYNAPDLPSDIHNQPSILPQEFLFAQQCPAGTWRPSDGDYLSELQDPLQFKDVMNGGFRFGSAFNTSAFSISMRRLASRPPIQDRVDSCHATHFSRAVHTPASHPTHQWISHDDPRAVDGISCTSPLLSAQQLHHPPFHPIYLPPAAKQRFDPGITSDWMWSQNSDVAFTSREYTFGDIHSRYSSTIYHQHNPTFPDIRINSPLHTFPSESDVSQPLPGILYSYTTTSPATTSDSAETVSAIGFPGQAAQAPPVIMPIPVYPVSYIHSEGVNASPSTHLP